MVKEVLAEATSDQAHAISAFERALSEYVANGGVVSIRLDPGQALFVNNRVVLHARDAIAPDSRRRLVRAYVVPVG